MPERRRSRSGNGDALRAKVTKDTGNVPDTVSFVTLTGLLNGLREIAVSACDEQPDDIKELKNNIGTFWVFVNPSLVAHPTGGGVGIGGLD